MDEFAGLVGYNRDYASFLLRWSGRKLILNRGDGFIVVMAGEARKIKRPRDRIYDEGFKKVLVWLWRLMDSSFQKAGGSLEVVSSEVGKAEGAEGKENSEGEVASGIGSDCGSAIEAGA